MLFLLGYVDVIVATPGSSVYDIVTAAGCHATRPLTQHIELLSPMLAHNLAAINVDEMARLALHILRQKALVSMSAVTSTSTAPILADKADSHALALLGQFRHLQDLQIRSNQKFHNNSNLIPLGRRGQDP